MKQLTGAAVRQLARSGDLTTQTSGLAPGYLQANLVVVPADLAFAFMLFCRRNPRPCPLLDVTDPGGFVPTAVAPNADLRVDIPRYRVYRHGQLIAEPTDLKSWWRNDLVAFLLGCSFTFETALLDANIPVRHIEQGRNVPMYRTNIACNPSGLFCGPMVVSMRPLTPRQADEATAICMRYPLAHGAPIHRGDPRAIGIEAIETPDFGDPVEIRPGEEPVFWACGVTPQAIAMSARPALLLTHAPGHMFVTDVRDRELVDRWVL